MLRFLSAITLLLALGTGLVRADNTQAFNTAVAESYAGYRAGTSYLRTRNPGLASLEIATALETWRSIIAAYSDAPPATYSADAAFKSALAEIGQKLEAALAEAEDGDSDTAAKTLTPVRDDLYSLRQRNGVRLYADCITELNRAIEPLYKHRHLTPDLGIPRVREQITAESRIYETLLLDCRGMAPKKYVEDQEFIRLFDGTTESIRSMFPAIDSGEPGRVINVLRELRSFDRIIYFRFGG